MAANKLLQINEEHVLSFDSNFFYFNVKIQQCLCIAIFVNVIVNCY